MRNDFLRLVGEPNEPLILIIIYYIFKYSVRIKTTLLESRVISSQARKRRFNDYPEREYTQVSGSGGPLLEKEGEDIVYSV